MLGPGFPTASVCSCRPESPRLPHAGEEQRSVSPAPAEPQCRKTAAVLAWQGSAGGTSSLVPATSALCRAGSEMRTRLPLPGLFSAMLGSAAVPAVAGVVRDVNERDAAPRGPAPPPPRRLARLNLPGSDLQHAWAREAAVAAGRSVLVRRESRGGSGYGSCAAFRGGLGMLWGWGGPLVWLHPSKTGQPGCAGGLSPGNTKSLCLLFCRMHRASSLPPVMPAPPR